MSKKKIYFGVLCLVVLNIIYVASTVVIFGGSNIFRDAIAGAIIGIISIKLMGLIK